MARSRTKNAQLGLPADTSLIGFQLHEGPLPSPQDFAAYEHVHPGAADRLLKMAELDQEARIKDQRTERRIRFILDIISQVILCGLVVAAVYLAINDKPLEAFFAGIGPIIIALYANARKAQTNHHE